MEYFMNAQHGIYPFPDDVSIRVQDVYGETPLYTRTLGNLLWISALKPDLSVRSIRSLFQLEAVFRLDWLWKSCWYLIFSWRTRNPGETFNPSVFPLRLFFSLKVLPQLSATCYQDFFLFRNWHVEDRSNRCFRSLLFLNKKMFYQYMNHINKTILKV